MTRKQAGVHAQFGNLYREQGQFPQAVRSFRQAEAVWEEVGRRHPDDRTVRMATAQVQTNLILLYRRLGELDAAVATFLKCRATLDELLAAEPTHLGCREALALCHQNIAFGYSDQDKQSDAEAAHLRALELCQQLLRDQPDSVKFRNYLAQTCSNLAVHYSQENQHEKADPLYKQSLAISEAQCRDYPTVARFTVELAGSYGNMARHVRTYRSAAASVEWLDKAVRTVEPVVERHPKNAQARLTLYNALATRCRVYDALGRVEDTTNDRTRLIAISDGMTHIKVRLSRPRHLTRLGDHARAAAEVEAVVAEVQTQPVNLYVLCHDLAACTAAAGKDERLPAEERVRLAEEYARRAVELLRQAVAAGFVKDSDRLADIRGNPNLDPIRSRDDFKRLISEWAVQVPKPQEALPRKK